MASRAVTVASRAVTVASREVMEVIKEATVVSREAMAASKGDTVEERRDVVKATTITTMAVRKAVLEEETLPREASKIPPNCALPSLSILTMTSYGGGGGYGGGGDFGGAMEHAQQHGGDSGDSSIFSSVLGKLSQNHQEIGNQGIDEQREI
jgi:hypothetical protein